MPNFDYVLFDLDGTLLNTLDDLADAGNWVCAQNGWPVHPTEAYKKMVGSGIPNLVRRFSPEHARTPEQLAATLAQFGARYGAHKEDKTQPYPGIPELLEQLAAAGVVFGVFSNKRDDLTRAVAEHYFPGRFAHVRGQREGCPVKPNPTGTRAILAEMGADPARTLYVGDSDVDIYTAQNAGLTPCGVLWGFRSREELVGAGARHLAADPAALARLILG